MLGLYRDSGKENGNYYIGIISYNTLGLYRDSGKEHENCYIIIVCMLGLAIPGSFKPEPVAILEPFKTCHEKVEENIRIVDDGEGPMRFASSRRNSPKRFERVYLNPKRM